MNALNLPIRLVVKAPNQQIDDQVIECAITWTVKKLKSYLSEVYPSNPKAEDQKLIYSGQLLPDNLMLKDILRQYDTEVVHTVHLVCMPSKDNVAVSSTSSANPVASTSTATSLCGEVPSAPTNSYSTEGVRHRTGMSTNNSEQRRDDQSSFHGHQNVFPNNYGVQVPASPDQLNQQLAWMHMYGQYMNFYMQHYQGIYSGVSPVVPTVQQPATVNDPPPAEQVNQENVQERQINEVRRLNAQGGPADDDEDEIGRNRDWLDWVYVFSRLSVLFAIVYFYSSLNRFVMVVLFGILIYIGGFWRRERLQRANNNNNVRERNDRPVENAQDGPQNVDDQQQENRDPAEQMQRETRELEETMDRDTETNNPVTQQTVSFLHIAWTFVATFFSSLLPQQQGAVNLN